MNTDRSTDGEVTDSGETDPAATDSTATDPAATTPTTSARAADATASTDAMATDSTASNATATDAAGIAAATTEIPDRSPARLSSAAATGAALLAFAVIGQASVVAFSLGALGAVGVLGGLAARNRGVVTSGAVVLFVGALAAGVADASVPRLLVAIGAVLFAWDVGRTAVTLGRQLGAAAETRAIELRHAAASLFVLVLSGSVGYAAFQVVGGAQPVLAVVALLIAGVSLSLVLD